MGSWTHGLSNLKAESGLNFIILKIIYPLWLILLNKILLASDSFYEGSSLCRMLIDCNLKLPLVVQVLRHWFCVNLYIIHDFGTPISMSLNAQFITLPSNVSANRIIDCSKSSCTQAMKMSAIPDRMVKYLAVEFLGTKRNIINQGDFWLSI